MKIEDILTPNRTFCHIQASSRKKALEKVSEYLAADNSSFDAEHLFTSLIAREKMGSTALPHGVAIPHCRMRGCSKIVGGLFSLEEPIDFESPDRTKTNLLFVLVVPEDEATEHLTVLAMLASRFDSEVYRESLFTAKSAQALYEAAVSHQQSEARQAQS